MSKQEIIRRLVGVLKSLPEAKAQELLNYANYLLVTSVRPDNGEGEAAMSHEAAAIQEDAQLTKGIMWLVENGGSFGFLYDEPDLYTDDDLIEKYDH